MKFPRKNARIKNKFGITLRVYPVNRKEAGVAYIETAKGHFEEFYNTKSTFIYYLLKGKGVFYLNGKKIAARATDLIVIPPMTKIYYIGKMSMMLTTVPAWQAKNEVRVRLIK